MDGFMQRFLISNILLGGMTGILLLSRRLFQNILRGRMRYRLWFLLPVLLAVPFLPLRSSGFYHIFPFLEGLRNASSPDIAALAGIMPSPDSSGMAKEIHDLALSVRGEKPAPFWFLLWWVWAAGCLVTLGHLVKSALLLKTLEKSALPLQNTNIRRVYEDCLRELKIIRNIPVYSTAFLQSPVIVGLLCPRIYLPIRLLSDIPVSQTDEPAPGKDASFSRTDGFVSRADILRYMLLHELQHYRHRDALLGASAVRRYLGDIRYGNQDISGGLSSYWLQSSLKISPVEQVELLLNLYRESFGFSPENTAAVRDAICLFSEGDDALYGKTGTGCVDGRDINGWFVGYATGPGRTLFFAVNIQGEEDANGGNAAKIALSILSQEDVWSREHTILP